MDFFSATTFGFMAPKGFTKNPESLDSLRRMFAGTGSDTLLLPVAACRTTPIPPRSTGPRTTS